MYIACLCSNLVSVHFYAISVIITLQISLLVIAINISYVLRAWEYGIYEPEGPVL